MNFKHSVGAIVSLLLVSGCAKSPLIQGNEAFHDGDFERAASHWIAPAQSGDADAQHNLGVLYEQLGNDELASFWWRRAVAQEFVPSMLWLARLEESYGELDSAVELYARAARWGSAEAREALTSLGAPVPRADLWLAYAREQEARQVLVARRLARPFPNQDLYRALDEAAAKPKSGTN